MAERLSYHDYWKEVRSLAENVRDTAADSGEDLYDVLHELTDGHEYAIYYFRHGDVMEHTDNQDAAYDLADDRHFRNEGWLGIRGCFAFWAFYQDVANSVASLETEGAEA